ncbi:polysaccharide deacetylase family protein [Clostridium thailandense]|uniref:Polysaccharide deacetylase n=1 Tax=Clostridium thailandense TaxID=2794346 RepID=A0A949U2Z9_9CLOT|nr:polysaccharide deacetylase family protein [Clostridium thailandense]MBV7276505.1 polysaccharide deacetylase [Clostridium thailandense]
MINKKSKFMLSILIFFIVFFNLISNIFHITNYSTVSASDPNHKVIYLTFDDGPSNLVNNKILDILNNENVKATFFIVGYKINGNEQTLKRIYTEGHSIGLHTYTHKYKKIYANDNAFIEEMDKTADEVKKVLGFSPRIIRFPSGSKKHLSENLLEKLHEKNYKIYDWNLSLSDGLDYNTPQDKLFREATQKCVNPSRIFLLAHCDQPNRKTCEILPKIIKYYKDLGYEFKAITVDTPEYHFRVSK